MFYRIVPYQFKTNKKTEVIKQAESNTCRLFSIRIWPKYSAYDETFKITKTVTSIKCSISDLTVISAFTSNKELWIKVKVYSISCLPLCWVRHIVWQAVVHTIHTGHWNMFCSIWQILASKRQHLYKVWKVMGILFSVWSSKKTPTFTVNLAYKQKIHFSRMHFQEFYLIN